MMIGPSETLNFARGGPVTVTVNEQLARLPATSEAEQVTVVVPAGKPPPDGGEHAIVAPGTLSATEGGGYVTIGGHCSPNGGVTTKLAGQLMTGAWLSITLTWNEQFAAFPDMSLTEQLTV